MNITGTDNQSNIDTPAYEAGAFEVSGDALFDAFSQSVSEAVDYIERFEEPGTVETDTYPQAETSVIAEIARDTSTEPTSADKLASEALDAVYQAYSESERPTVSFEVDNDQFSLGA